MLELSHHLRQHLPKGREFETLFAMTGDVVRDHKNRTTSRISIGGRDFFLKIHRPTSLRELLKNSLRGRWPVLTSKTEWDAIHALNRLLIPTTPGAGCGVRGSSPLGLESFLITEALPGMIHLSDLPPALRRLTLKPRTRLRRRVIHDLAVIARTLHTNGLNHRDFYLCHFMLRDRDWMNWTPDDPLNLHVIDLHRMQIRRASPANLSIKDVSGLLFSALDAGLTSRECLRFLSVYWNSPWRDLMDKRRRWCTRVVRRAISLYRSEHGMRPRLPGGLSSFA